MIKKRRYFYKLSIFFTVAFSFITTCSTSIIDKDFNTKKKIVTDIIEKREEFSVLCMGDLLVANIAEKIMMCNGLDYPFRKIENEFKKYDIVFANLETSITRRGEEHPTKPYRFRLHPKNAKYMKNLKIDVLSLANNHILDYGPKGMYDTMSFIKKWGAKYVGVGWNLKQARKAVRIKRKKTNVFFLAYCGRPPKDFYAQKSKGGIAPMDIKIISEDISKYKKDNNLVMVSLHWGIEHTEYPRKYQIKLARQIIDAGADAIIGHHPHRPQGIEIYKNKPIIYSLGNVISGFYEPNYKNNIMVSLRYRNNKMIGMKVIPIAGKNGDIHFQPYVLKGDEAVKTLDNLNKISKPFNTNITICNNVGLVNINPNNFNNVVAKNKSEEVNKN